MMNVLRLFKWRFRWECDVEDALDTQRSRIDKLERHIQELSEYSHCHRSCRGVGRTAETAETQYGVVRTPLRG